MENYDLDPDNNRWCKTLYYKCIENIDTNCNNCKFVHLIDGKFSKNYDHFDKTNICSECGVVENCVRYVTLLDISAYAPFV